MKKRSTASKHCALLWDESFLWGVMAFNGLESAGLPFDLFRSQDIRNGNLRDYSMLFVPGGWASNKIKSLGDDGVRKIREFVQEGGNYLGFCGGAGLATLDGIGLLNISRIPTQNRVPSFSGRSQFRTIGHPMWTGLAESQTVFHVWWPSQFAVVDQKIEVLATYQEAFADSFSSDLNVGDVRKYIGSWNEIEQSYGINLNPNRLRNQPAVLEGRSGKGKVLLSLVHFDTPNDKNGKVVLQNLWKYLANADMRKRGVEEVPKIKSGRAQVLDVMIAATEELIAFGERNFLWFWRNPMLLQWRRGIRGLEYCTLYGMITAIIEHADSMTVDEPKFLEQIDEVLRLLLPFKEKAKKLLLLERNALHNGDRITYAKSDNPEITKLRSKLFSTSKSYGGMFKELLDKIDTLLYALLRTA